MSLFSSKKESTLYLATKEFNLSSNKEERILKYFTPHMYTYIHSTTSFCSYSTHLILYIYDLYYEILFLLFFCLLLSVYQVLENTSYLMRPRDYSGAAADYHFIIIIIYFPAKNSLDSDTTSISFIKDHLNKRLKVLQSSTSTPTPTSHISFHSS